jgi:formate-dependent phosphoribosylglycinamide formyltransferase (GAR transformylase)
VERTVIRKFGTKAMLLGASGLIAHTITLHFEALGVRVLRVDTAAEACAGLAEAMPQVVVVLGSLDADEREMLAEHATAVGALLCHMDPALDLETLETMAKHVARATVERKRAREESARTSRSEPPPGSADIDTGWTEPKDD